MLFVIDTETGGLEPTCAGVWNLGCVAIQDREIVSEFETLVFPGREHLQPQHRDVMQRISGLTDADILRLLDQDVPDVVGARKRLTEWMAGLTGAKHAGEDVKGEKCTAPRCSSGQIFTPGPNGLVPTGHCGACRGSGYLDVPRTIFRLTSYNRGFDSKFVEHVHWSLPFHVSANFHAQVEWAPCLMIAASDHLGPKLGHPQRPGGGYRWVKLPFACERLGVPFVETHRALDDARAAARIAIALGVG